MVLSPEVEEGELVVRDAEKEVVCEGDFNPFVSLAPLVNGVHLLDSVPLLLKPIYPVENLLHLEMNDSSLLAFSRDLQ